MLRLRDLPTELEKRGNDRLKDMYWHPDSPQLAAIWTGILFALATEQKPLITGEELLSFCLELESAGVENTEWFKKLKAIAFEMKKKRV